MEPMLQDSENGDSSPPAVENRPVYRDESSNRAFFLRSAPESRLNDRPGRLLSQKRGTNTVMVGVLGVALFLGIALFLGEVGFAHHVLWVITIVVLALGLGYAIAISHRDRMDVMNQRAEAARGNPTAA